MSEGAGATEGPERRPAWLRSFRIYLTGIAAGNLAWETLQLPLYTIWETGLPRAQAFAVVHCTAGDLLIALSALTLSLLLAGHESWPHRRFWVVAGLTLIFGVAYTIFSEWLNVVVRASWAYSDRMPLVAAFGLRIGLAPLLQWIAVPAMAFTLVRFIGSRAPRPRRRP
jgi:hypothetical protein